MTISVVSLRRTGRGFLGLLLAASVLAPATPALGWGTGGGDAGYGTHQWIVDQAVKVLDGRASAWFDARTARLSVDDPDTIERNANDPNGEHVYRNVGRRGGAVERGATEYDLAFASYQAGVVARDAGDAATAHADFEDASYHIGLLAHFVGDLSQPFHTSYDGLNKSTLHYQYEELVGRYTTSPSSAAGWQSPRRTVSAIGNIRTTMGNEARYTAGFFGRLYDSLTSNGVRMTSAVDDVTGSVLKRASNDLADIIWSISQGAGAQAEIGSIRIAVNWTGVAANYQQTINVRALDVNGKPIEGLKVTVLWPLSTGAVTEVLYTDANGYQMRHASVGSSPRLTPLTVTASATVRGTTKSTNAWWAITPAWGSFQTRMADTTVVPGQTVKVVSIAKDGAGRPIPNVLVDWTWKIGSRTVKTYGITDATGRATGSMLVTTAMPMTTIYVTAHAQSGSHNRTMRVTFKRVA